MHHKGIRYFTACIAFGFTIGTLSFYKNGEPLGVAFRGLHVIEGQVLFPVVCSAVAENEVMLKHRSCRFFSLQEKCFTSILRNLRNKSLIHELGLPNILCHRMAKMLWINTGELIILGISLTEGQPSLSTGYVSPLLLPSDAGLWIAVATMAAALSRCKIYALLPLTGVVWCSAS